STIAGSHDRPLQTIEASQASPASPHPLRQSPHHPRLWSPHLRPFPGRRRDRDFHPSLEHARVSPGIRLHLLQRGFVCLLRPPAETERARLPKAKGEPAIETSSKVCRSRAPLPPCSRVRGIWHGYNGLCGFDDAPLRRCEQPAVLQPLGDGRGL